MAVTAGGRRIVVAITGASGAVYGVRLLRALCEAGDVRSHLVVSPAGWRNIALLRGYCKYLRQAGIAFSQAYMEQTLNANAGITRDIAELFYAMFDSGVAGRGLAFILWLTVFNLFAVAVFWSFMADVYSNVEARRYYGYIGAAGTLGAFLGPALTRTLVERVGIANMMLVSAVLLTVCVVCILRLRRYAVARETQQGLASGEKPMGGEILAGLKDHLNVISGLTCDKARANGDGPGDHARAMAAFLTGRQPRKTHGADIRVGMSADQHVATAIGDQTRFPSLELGIERGLNAGNCDSGYSCAYSANLSWRSESTPNAKETDPKAVFDRLFGGHDPKELAEARAKRELYNKSILDFVTEDAKGLDKTLGSGDVDL